MHLCPFLQSLISAAISGDLEAVRTLLSGSAGSKAGFINGRGEVRETLTFLLSLLLLLLSLLLLLLLILLLLILQPYDNN
jgi:hypothetical protein